MYIDVIKLGVELEGLLCKDSNGLIVVTFKNNLLLCIKSNCLVEMIPPKELFDCV